MNTTVSLNVQFSIQNITHELTSVYCNITINWWLFFTLTLHVHMNTCSIQLAVYTLWNSKHITSLNYTLKISNKLPILTILP